VERLTARLEPVTGGAYMNRLDAGLGIAAGTILLASSVLHSLMGWPGLSIALGKIGAPADLITGLRIGWHFAGAAMLAFGFIVLSSFIACLRGRTVSLLPAAVIAAIYVVFGAWALVVSDFEPFFLVFVVPGLLLAVAARGARA
jgi:hypothetical protein